MRLLIWKPITILSFEISFVKCKSDTNLRFIGGEISNDFQMILTSLIIILQTPQSDWTSQLLLQEPKVVGDFINSL